jgi:hypothetical protein
MFRSVACLLTLFLWGWTSVAATTSEVVLELDGSRKDCETRSSAKVFRGGKNVYVVMYCYHVPPHGGDQEVVSLYLRVPTEELPSTSRFDGLLTLGGVWGVDIAGRITSGRLYLSEAEATGEFNVETWNVDDREAERDTGVLELNEVRLSWEPASFSALELSIHPEISGWIEELQDLQEKNRSDGLEMQSNSSVAGGAATGRDLLRQCSLMVRILDGENLAEDDRVRGFQCAEYIRGVRNTHAQFVQIGVIGRPIFVVPRSTKTGELVRAVTKYLTEHPDELSEEDALLVVKALKTGYPDKPLKVTIVNDGGKSESAVAKEE